MTQVLPFPEQVRTPGEEVLVGQMVALMMKELLRRLAADHPSIDFTLYQKALPKRTLECAFSLARKRHNQNNP